MLKKAYIFSSLLLVVSCSTVEYKGNSGTDLGKKNAYKVKFDGTDYYKIYGEDLPKSDKKVVPTTPTKAKVIDSSGSQPNEYKKPDTNDTASYLFPLKILNVKRAYKEGTFSGIDFSVNPNTDIYAVAPGMVIFADEKASLGKSIFIYHNNGYVSIYTNLDKLNLKKGDYINSSNDVIAKASGSFGFELRKRTDDGTIPLDPNKYLKKR